MHILDIKEDFASINDDLAGGNFVADIYANSAPTRFKDKYLETIKASDKIDAYINCNLIDIILNDSLNSVEHVIALNYQQQQAKLSASAFILAMGAVENARILLNANSQIPQGVGNNGGFVGKCFMEHLNIVFGEFLLKDEEGVDSLQYYTSEDLVNNKGVGKGNLTFGVIQTINSGGRLGFARQFFKNLACDLGIEDKVQFISNFKCPGTGVITTLLEQFPNPDSKITLSDEKDSLGLRKAIFDWQITELDRQGLKITGEELAKNFADSGMGVIKLEDYILDINVTMPVSPHAHHMGSTRMSETVEFGVVDPNCRVFDTDNLYIAGSSIFATGGGMNPTMPIVQFALRLANHLQQHS